MGKISNIILLVVITCISIKAQNNRINYNNQKLFLSGSNLAWVSFASDVNGVNAKDNAKIIADWMLQMHDNGGNAMRWWIHTDGTSSPVFETNNIVTGPGTNTISDIKTVLDLAWEREVGIDLCLWSFDMLNKSKTAAVINRNTLLLTDTSYTNAYIKNCLIPMVRALKGHPAIVTWEIFNEPEGMSNEFGWSNTHHVPMPIIQRFVNLCASAIHEADPTAKVTNGCWAFAAMSDVTLAKVSVSDELNLADMSQAKKKDLEDFVLRKYGYKMTADEIVKQFQKLLVPRKNYYSDSELIAAGGKSNGTLDFYSVHYYTRLGSLNSPFVHASSFWSLDKPIVIGEFACSSANDGISKEVLYQFLYGSGYAGALAWSWTDSGFSTQTDMLASMLFMWNYAKSSVDILGIGGDWPTISITSPAEGASFAAGAQIPITVNANDKDGSVVSVDYYADTIKIGTVTTIPFPFTWTNANNGNYTLTAVATDNQGHKRTSTAVKITVGNVVPITKLEAERQVIEGSGWTIKTDPNASGGAFVDFPTNDTNVKITWQVKYVPAPGNYEIIFGYKLAYDVPKSQFININGSRLSELQFDGPKNSWLEKKITVNLIQGVNTIQMQLSWGWMYVDYLAVPTSFVTAIEKTEALPEKFSLYQNYPNPFNPSTTIGYQLPEPEFVSLKVYDVLGKEVATLVNEYQNAGRYNLQFSTHNIKLSSGLYFYRLKTGNFVSAKKMVLIK